MNYPAHIAFVNSHSKGNGGAYHLHAVIDEVVLCFISSCRRQSCMIDRRLYPLFLKHLCHCFSLAAAHAINDAALSRMAGDEVEDGFAFFLLLVTSFTVRLRLGRSKDEMKILGWLRCSCLIISSRVILSAVAVSAMMGTWGNSW